MLHEFIELKEGDWVIQNGNPTPSCPKFKSTHSTTPRREQCSSLFHCGTMDYGLTRQTTFQVGQAVIQIAARKGINTINFVRNR